MSVKRKRGKVDMIDIDTERRRIPDFSAFGLPALL